MSSGCSVVEDPERELLLRSTSVASSASHTALGSDGVTNDDRAGKNDDIDIPYALIKFSIAWLGVFLANIDLGLVLATYSSIASDLGDLEHAAWLITGYQLGYSVALPLYGAISDAYGRKVPLLLCYALFGLGSLLAGVGPNLPAVTAGRLIQGIGGAGATTVVTIIIRDLMQVSRAVVLLSYLNVAAIVGRGAGGPIGGLLYDSIGWRWSLVGQAPIALVCFVGAATQTLPSAPSTKQAEDAAPKEQRRLDIQGLPLFVTAMTSFLIGTDYASQGFHISRPIVLVPLIIFIISIISLIYVEIYVSSHPMFAPSLFKEKGVTSHYLIQMFLLSAQFAALADIPTYFIRTSNVSTTIASLVLVPAPLGNAFGSYAASKFIERTKRYLPPLYLTCILSPATFATMLLRWSPLPLPWKSSINEHGHAATAQLPISPWECIILAPAAFSVGMAASVGFVGVSAGVTQEQSAVALSVLYLSQQMGLIIGAAGGTGIASISFASFLTRELGSDKQSEEIISKALRDTRWVWHHSSQEVQKAVAYSYAMGYMSVSIFALVCVCLAVPVIVMMPRYKVE